ncbi:MAG TPA: DUF4191 domain-containing protein [Microbacteriaceae bacterium]|nr:DUF4191 domain-containing protein [Microbacteriaceae bacterium]
MPRNADSAKPKTPNRFGQMWQVFTMTRRSDRALVPLMALALLGPIAAGIVLGNVLGGDWLTLTLWIVLGVMTGVLVGLIVLGRRAEKTAYAQIEGQPGAVGAVLRSGIRGGWISQEMPVGVTKQQDAVYRVVGRGGIVVIAEGDKTRTAKLISDEEKRAAKLAANVPVRIVHVGLEAGDVRLAQLTSHIRRTRNVLTKAEVSAVNNRLSSMQGSLPIPKGIDPTKARMPRGKMR